MRTMTVGQLIELLSDYDEAAEVRLACQPSWPFEYSVAGVVALSEIKRQADRDPEPDDDPDMPDRHPSTGISEKPPEVVYIAEGRQISYGTKLVWDLC